MEKLVPLRSFSYFLEGQLTMREFATLFEWDHRKVPGTVIVDYMLVSQIKDDERRAQEEDRCDLRCVFCHKIKTELFGDFMKTSVEYEYDPHLDAEKIRVKMERYESDTDPNCQGPCLMEKRNVYLNLSWIGSMRGA
jgi:hypothetical protein